MRRRLITAGTVQLGPAESLYTVQVPHTEQPANLGPAERMLGLRFTCNAAGYVTGGRYRVPAIGLPPTALWELWHVTDQVKLSSVDLTALPAPTPGTWMTFNSAPIALNAGEEYKVVNYTVLGNIVYTDDGSEVFPLNSANLSASIGCFLNSGGPNDFPVTDYAAYFFSDVIFQPTL